MFTEILSLITLLQALPASTWSAQGHLYATEA
jgi:hypothetical protein